MGLFFESFVDPAVEPDESVEEKIEDTIEDGLNDTLVADKMKDDLSDDQIREFIASKESKKLIEAGVVTERLIGILESHISISESEKVVQAASLVIAKNKGDERFDKIIDMKKELEGTIADVIEDYKASANTISESYAPDLFSKISILNK